jgi:phosphoglycolate phosphatase
MLPADSRRTVVFDLDGTLAATGPDIMRALNASLNEAGVDAMPRERMHELVSLGRGPRAMIEHCLGLHGRVVHASSVQRMADRYVEIYHENVAVESTLFAGCASVLEALRQRDDGLAVCTNKPERCIVEGGHPRQQRVLLEDDAALGARSDDRPAVHRHAAVRRPQETRDGREQRRLAAPARSEHAKELVGRDAQVQVLDGPMRDAGFGVRIIERQILDDDLRGGGFAARGSVIAGRLDGRPMPLARIREHGANRPYSPSARRSAHCRCCSSARAAWSESRALSAAMTPRCSSIASGR